MVNRMADQSPETMNDVPTFIHKNGKSTVRNCAEAAMLECGLDPNDWRLRDKLIWAMNPWIQKEAEERIDAARNAGCPVLLPQNLVGDL